MKFLFLLLNCGSEELEWEIRMSKLCMPVAHTRVRKGHTSPEPHSCRVSCLYTPTDTRERSANKGKGGLAADVTTMT